MSIKTLWIQGPGGGALEYSAEDFRTFITEVFAPGVLGGGFGVSERAAGANMTVTVAAGRAVIEGTDGTGQGNYLARMDAAEDDVAIGAAPGSGTRHDLVGLRVLDVTAGGPSGQHQTEVVVVAGTASSSPADPAFPDSFLPLARVRVPTGTVSITDALIDDLREPARLAHKLVDTAAIKAQAVTNAKIRHGAARSVIGRSAGSSGAVADIAAGTDGHVLRRSGSTIGFGTVTEDGLASAVLSSSPGTPFSYASGWSGTGSGRSLLIKRIGNVVFAVGGVQRTGSGIVTGDATTTILTLDEGWQPGSFIRIEVPRSDSVADGPTSRVGAQVNASGRTITRIQGTGPVPNGAVLWFNQFWFV